MSTIDQVRNEALRLTPEERAELARDLLVSLEPAFDSDAEAAWAEQIEARSNAVASGAFNAIDWRESVGRIRRQLRNGFRRL